MNIAWGGCQKEVYCENLRDSGSNSTFAERWHNHIGACGGQISEIKTSAHHKVLVDLGETHLL
jgi:hypothetical protein